jgi:hypothetical protein
MSSLYFGLDVFCQFEARIPELNEVFSVQTARNTASPKYNDDISLLISQYLISGFNYQERISKVYILV